MPTIDHSAPVIEPPTEIDDLYSHLQMAQYHHLPRCDVKLGKKLGSGYVELFLPVVYVCVYLCVRACLRVFG